MEEQSISLERHSRKDKFHLLRVPKGFDIKQLHGVTYDPEQTLEIETKRDESGLVTMYELGALSKQSLDLNVLVKAEDNIKIGPVIKQTFCITKTVHMDKTETHFAVASLQSAPSGNVHFPEGLKERFTPFGRNCPLSPKRESLSKKDRKRKKSQEATSLPAKQSGKDSQEDMDISMDGTSHNDSIAEFGDARLGVPPELFVIDKKGKNKKHKKKKYQSSDGESEHQVNGDSGLSDVNMTPGKNGHNSSSLISDCGDSFVMKSPKKKRKHSLSDEAIHLERDDSKDQTSDESLLKEKRHKEKKKKKKDRE